MKIFTTSRELNGTPGEVFAAFKNSNILARWWGPSGFTNTFNQFNFETGGKWSFIMHGPDGNNYPNEAVFREVIPNEKIVIRHFSPDFTLTLEIKESGNGSTIYWKQEFDSEELAKNIAYIIIPSNEQNLDRLEAQIYGNRT